MRTQETRVATDALLDELRLQFFQTYEPWPLAWGKGIDLVTEYFSRQGKALRPLFLLVGYLMALKQKDPRVELGPSSIPSGVWKLAGDLERFHTAVLALDDVIDGSTERRGGLALHLMLDPWCLAHPYDDGRLFQSPAGKVLRLVIDFITEVYETILSITGQPGARCNEFSPRSSTFGRRGAYYQAQLATERYFYNQPPTTKDIVTHVAQVISDLGRDLFEREVNSLQYELLSMWIDSLRRTLEGEMVDIRMSRKGEIPDLDSLLWLQRQKTTVYSVELPLVLGMTLANPQLLRSTMNCVLAMAEQFGSAFQMQDDLLVLTPPEIAGKSVLADLTNGSMTAATVGTYQLLEGAEKDHWPELLKKCAKSKRAVAQALKTMRRCDVTTFIGKQIEAKLAECSTGIQELEVEGYPAQILGRLMERGIGWIDDNMAEEGGG